MINPTFNPPVVSLSRSNGVPGAWVCDGKVVAVTEGYTGNGDMTGNRTLDIGDTYFVPDRVEPVQAKIVQAGRFPEIPARPYDRAAVDAELKKVMAEIAKRDAIALLKSKAH